MIAIRAKLLPVGLLVVLHSILIPVHADYTWVDTPGKHLDLMDGLRPVVRYVYEAIDDSTPERREETYKPFCHVFERNKKDSFITKGPGGKFTHHRGIFYGFSQITYTTSENVVVDKVDTWHCRNTAQIHRFFSEQTADAKQASITSQIDWIGPDGKPFARESRTMAFTETNSDLAIDFKSILTPLVPKMKVDGDPQHAGLQFRASQSVETSAKQATYYIRPGSGKGIAGQTINWSPKTDNELTRDQAWKGLCFQFNDKAVSVAYLDHPKNPKPARYSERDYGRFGSYFTTEITPEEPLSIKYRLVIRAGEYTAEEIATLSETFLKG